MIKEITDNNGKRILDSLFISRVPKREIVTEDQRLIGRSTAGLIIGRGGKTVSDICKRTGARISMNPGDNRYETLSTITGSVEAVKSAKRMIKDLENRK